MYKVTLTQDQWNNILDIFYGKDGDEYPNIGPWLRDRYECIRVERIIELEKTILFFKYSQDAMMFKLKHV